MARPFAKHLKQSGTSGQVETEGFLRLFPQFLGLEKSSHFSSQRPLIHQFRYAIWKGRDLREPVFCIVLLLDFL